MKGLSFICLLLTCLFQLNGLGQHPIEENPKLKLHKVGILYGQGSQVMMSVKYDYKVQLIQFQYNYTLYQKNALCIELLAQPQFNFTKYRINDSAKEILRGYEFGLNAGLLLKKERYNGLISTYVGLSAGPHFISGAPIRQASGFIFSDNFFIGLTAKLDRNIYLDLRPCFRHISNANLVHPNKGINNFILNAGLFVELD